MKAETEFILQCNRNSFIEQVMYVSNKLDAGNLLNQPLLFCLSPDYLEVGKRFLDEIRWAGKAENFDLEILLQEEKHIFTFSGVLLGEHIIIVARHTLPAKEPDLPLAEMVAGEVEQTINDAKPQEAPEEKAEITIWDLMEEMSRLNNELINTKRELIRKNIELERLQAELKKR